MPERTPSWGIFLAGPGQGGVSLNFFPVRLSLKKRREEQKTRLCLKKKRNEGRPGSVDGEEGEGPLLVPPSGCHEGRGKEEKMRKFYECGDVAWQC